MGLARRGQLAAGRFSSSSSSSGPASSTAAAAAAAGMDDGTDGIVGHG